MKVLHLLSSNIFSGAEHVVCQIIKIAETNPDVKMVYCSPDGSIRDELEKLSIDYIAIDLKNPFNIRRVIMQQAPDIIHAHDVKACMIATLIKGNIPLICHIHSNPPEASRVSLRSLLLLATSRRVNHIFWVSETAMNDYCFAKNISKISSVLRNIVDIDSLYEKVAEDRNDYSYDIVFVGRMVPEKDPQRFIDIVNCISNEIPTIKAAMIGDGEIIASLNLIPNIDMLGFVSNPMKLISSAKIMIMTSKAEGIPVAALEAMALGTPIISTPVGGMKEIIIEGVTGFLKEKNEDIASCALSVINDKDLKDRLSDHCKSISKQKNNTTAYYSELMNIYNLFQRKA